MQNNAEAIAFFLTLPVMCGLGFVAYHTRNHALRSPQRVTNSFMVRAEMLRILRA